VAVASRLLAALITGRLAQTLLVSVEKKQFCLPFFLDALRQQGVA
jgi:hypothetical protein